MCGGLLLLLAVLSPVGAITILTSATAVADGEPLEVSMRVNASDSAIRYSYTHPTRFAVLRHAVLHAVGTTILHVTLFGERDLGQSARVSHCLVLPLDSNHTVTPSAAATISQSNLRVPRVAEEVVPTEVVSVDSVLVLPKLPRSQLKWQLAQSCQGAPPVGSRDSLLHVLQLNHIDHPESVIAQQHSGDSPPPTCSHSQEPDQPCACEFNWYLPWFACGVKACRNSNSQDCALTCSQTVTAHLILGSSASCIS